MGTFYCFTLHKCVYERQYVHKSAETVGGQKRPPDLQELELQPVVSHLERVLGVQLSSSAKAGHFVPLL